MKKRKVNSISNIFTKNFDLSIFNQIFNDLKKKQSTEIIVKNPKAYNNLGELTFFSEINSKENNKTYKNIFENNPNNPNDINILKNYKKNVNYIRDDILEKDYNKILEKKINAYKNFN